MVRKIIAQRNTVDSAKKDLKRKLLEIANDVVDDTVDLDDDEVRSQSESITGIGALQAHSKKIMLNVVIVHSIFKV